jgi:hypothetical protein
LHVALSVVGAGATKRASGGRDNARRWPIFHAPERNSNVAAGLILHAQKSSFAAKKASMENLPENAANGKNTRITAG